MIKKEELLKNIEELEINDLPLKNCFYIWGTGKTNR